MNPKTAKQCVRVIPDNLADFGEEAVAAGAELLRLRLAREDLDLEIRELTAGASEPSPYVIGRSVARLSHPHRAAIEADHKLADDALKAGKDPGDIGTPHEDAHLAAVRSTKARLEATKRAETDADRRLFAALHAGAGRAAEVVRSRIVETGQTYRQEVESLIARRRAFWKARADLDFVARVLEPEPSLPLFVDNSGVAGQIRLPNRYISLSFGEVVELLTVDARVPDDVQPKKVEPVVVADEVSTMRSFRAAGTAPAPVPSADDRFTSELPRRTRARLVEDGSIR